MLEALLGSEIREGVLIFLFNRKEGYAREISRFYNTDLNQIQKQLERLETGGILYSRNIGKTRLYSLNPRYPFLTELNALLAKVVSYQQQTMEEINTIENPPKNEANRYQSYDPDFVD